MTDIVDSETRSRMMSGIRGKDTKPEMQIRRVLHRAGFRYRLHDKKLPGKPDMVFPKYRALIQVNGCFWHGHDCHLFRLPLSRTDFWEEKIGSNIRRDRKNLEECHRLGWKTLVLWECAVKGRTRLEPDVLMERIQQWIVSGTEDVEIAGFEIG